MIYWIGKSSEIDKLILSEYFSDSDEKRTRSLQSSHCWAWNNWLPSNMRFHLHTQTLSSAILLCLIHCSGLIFDCHQHLDEIPSCLSKLFLQALQFIEQTKMVQKQILVEHLLKSQKKMIFLTAAYIEGSVTQVVLESFKCETIKTICFF